MPLARDEFGELVEVADESAFQGATGLARATSAEEAKVARARAPKTLLDYGFEGADALNSVVDMGQAVQLGFASGVTGGISDAAIALDDESRQTALRLREESPYAALGGEIGSMLIPVGVAGKIASGGNKAREALTLGSSSWTRNMLARGAVGAAEGGAMGVQSAITEAALGDTELTGEKILQHVGIGAALGGIIGGGEGFVVGAARKGKKGLQSLIESAGEPKALTPEMASKLGDDTLEAAQRELTAVEKGYMAMNPAAKEVDVRAITDARTGKGPKASQERGKRIMKYMNEEDRHAAMNARSYEMQQPLDELMRADKGFDDALRNFDTRRELQGGLIDRANFSKSKLEMADEFDGLYSRMQAAGELGINDLPGFRKAMSRLEKIGDDVFGAREVDDLGEYIGRNYHTGHISKSPDEAFASLNKLKSELDDLAGRARRDANGASYLRDIEEASDGVDRMLQNSRYWGDQAATAQRDLASANRAVLDARANMGKSFLGEKTEGGLIVERADLARIRSLLNSGERPASLQKMEQMNAYLDAVLNRAEMVQKHLKPTAETAEQITRLRSAQSAMAEAHRLAMRDVVEFAAAKTAKAGGGQYGLNLLAFGAASTLGLPGLAGAFGADVVGRYPMFSRRIYNLKEMIDKSDNRVLKSVKNLFSRTRPDGAKPATGNTPTPARAKRRGNRMAGTTRALTQAGKTITEQYEAAVEAISQPDAAILARAQESFGDLGEVAPQSTGIAAGRTLAGVQYLRSKLPHVDPQFLPMNPRWGDGGPKPSFASMKEFMDRVNAVSDPIAVIENAKNGRVTRPMVEAIREVYPKLYQDIQQKVMSVALQAENPPPYSSLVAMSVLFDVPAHPTQQPEFVLRMQSLYALPAAAAPPPSKSSGSKTGLTEEYVSNVGGMSDKTMGPLDDRM